MIYTMTTPCDQCPFLKSMAHGFTIRQLEAYASSEFGCHKACVITKTEDGADEFTPTENTPHCAGALIYLEKRGRSRQMMRICERIGLYDRTKLDMKAAVR